jgi:ABC-2 type transport system ATP-binding protein
MISMVSTVGMQGRATPILELSGVRKRFGGTAALDGVDAQIAGRAIGLLGPNGAGKTTLMKVMLGLIPPDSGQVKVLGIDATRHPREVRMKLGYAAEGPGRMPGLSGLESVAYAAELCGLDRRAALLRAHDMLDLVGLDEARYRDVEAYSTGMHQRVKVAMALVHDPELVLLDEPTSGLDPQSRDALLDLVVHLRDGGGPAVLLSTHLLKDVERTCDAVMIMQAGQVRFAGTLDALRLPRPATWDVRLARPCPELVTTLQSRGAQVVVGRRPEVMEVSLPAGLTAEHLWGVIAATDAAVFHLEPRAASLEEAFLHAIGGEP